jgi:hypothetical protein
MLDFLKLKEVDLNEEPKALTSEKIREIMRVFSIGILMTGEHRGSLHRIQFNMHPLQGNTTHLLSLQEFTPLLEAIDAGDFELGKNLAEAIPVVDILSAGLMEKEFRQTMEKVFGDLFIRARELSQCLAKEEKDDILQGLF